MSADPPLETSGSGTPMTGSSPTTAPMLTRACPRIHARTPAVAILTKMSSVREHDPEQPDGEQREQREDGERADEPELLADDREDEVVVRLGQPRPLLPALPQAEAPPAAGGQRPERVQRLPAGALRVAAPGRSSARAGPSGWRWSRPGSEHARPRRARRPRRRPRSGTPAANISAPTRPMRTSAVPRSRPASTRSSSSTVTGSTGTTACTVSANSGRLRSSTAAHPDDEGELDGLGRLQREAGDAHPVLVAVDRVPRDDDEQQRADADEQQGPGQRLPGPHRQQRGDDAPAAARPRRTSPAWRRSCTRSAAPAATRRWSWRAP